jgi:DNA-binding MurR/RpiR family transcriptional regulator
MESVLFVIREQTPRFSATEGKIASYVLQHPREVLSLTVAQLAEQVEVSQAAVVRFCRRIGARSYGDFKLRLSHDVFRTSEVPFLPDVELKPGADPAELVKGILRSFQRSLAHLESLIDLPKLEQAVQLLKGARAVYAFGIGASALVAMDLHLKLLRLGFLCVFSADSDLQVTASCTLKPTDVAFIISYSGETPTMLSVAANVKKQGAKVLTLTRDTDNSLRRMADVSLVVPVTEGVYRTGAILSRITQLAVVDMIYSLLIVRDLDGARSSIERTMEAVHPPQARKRKAGKAG